MPRNHIKEKTWDDLTADAAATSQNFRQVVYRASEDAREWKEFRDGRNDADVATSLGKTPAEIQDLDKLYAAFSSVETFLNNGPADPPVAARNFTKALRQFTR